MQTTLFPSTFISEPAIESLSALFGPLIVYQPVEGAVPENIRRCEAAGRTRIRIPVKERSTELLKLSQSYRRWVETHPAPITDFLKLETGAGSLRESSAFSIRDEIRRKFRENAESPAPDALMTARLFLLFAQENDLQQTEIREGFKRLDQMEKRLFRSLKGEPPDGKEDSASRNFFAEAAGMDLSALRRTAWSLLLAQDDQKTGSYVTLSKAAFEGVLDDLPPECLAQGFDPEPVCVPMEPESGLELRPCLEALAESAARGEGIPIRFDDFPPIARKILGTVGCRIHPKIQLTLRVVKDKTPLELFLPKGGGPHVPIGSRLSSNTLLWQAEFFCP